MRWLGLTFAFSVFSACLVTAVPTMRIVSETTDASVVAVITADRSGDVHALPPVEGEERDEDSENGSEDSADDSDLELVGVLPNVVSFAVARGSEQRWTSTHARPKEDPDPTDTKRPPITA